MHFCRVVGDGASVAWSRWMFLWMLIVALGFGAGTPHTTWGQDAAAPEAAAEDVEAPAPDGAANVAAVPAVPPAATPDPPSYLEWTFQALGWLYSIVFLLLSFTLVALIVMNLLTIRRENVCPLQLVETFEANLNEKKYQDAYELAKSDESFMGQVLSAGLAKLSTGYPQAIEAMQEVGEEESMKIEHRLSYMALIGSISPMIGLFGTVDGMIRSFQVIATSTTSPKPSELAAGISTALFTTLLGLLIAIPAIFAHHMFRNRVARLVLEVGILSDNLMSRFDSKKK